MTSAEVAAVRAGAILAHAARAERSVPRAGAAPPAALVSARRDDRLRDIMARWRRLERREPTDRHRHGGTMDDLLSDARQLRQKLYRLEVLLHIEKGRRSRGWFAANASADPERAAAVRALAKAGLIETAPPPIQYRLTSEGREFLKDIRSKVSANGELDWARADEIDFSRL